MNFKNNWRTKLEYKSILIGIEDVKKRNKKFHSLNTSNRRKEIALDVLSMLDQHDIVASSGCYWNRNLQNTLDDASSSQELQELLLDSSIYTSLNCEVCARGAMMLSTIRLGNRINPRDSFVDQGDEGNQKHFTTTMFHEMEYVYEHLRKPYQHNSKESLANIYLQVVQTGKFSECNKTDYLELIIT